MNVLKFKVRTSALDNDANITCYLDYEVRKYIEFLELEFLISENDDVSQLFDDKHDAREFNTDDFKRKLYCAYKQAQHAQKNDVCSFDFYYEVIDSNSYYYNSHI